jgi:hypothetical protein
MSVGVQPTFDSSSCFLRQLGIPVVSSQSCDLPENDNNKNSLIIKLQFLIIYNEIVFLSFLYLTFPSLNCLQAGKVFVMLNVNT